jgi:chaperone modulatory protein CbpM
MQSRQSFRRAPMDDTTLEAWVEVGWLTPHQSLSGQRFSDVDLARARLICDLQDLGVNDEGIPIVLDLVDQIHGLRYVLREVLLAVRSQRREQDPA